MIEVTNIRVRSFDLSYLDVYWDTAPGYEDVNDFQFIVEAAEKEFGPYYAVSAPLVNLLHFRDGTVRGQHSFYHERWYRIRVQWREVAKQLDDAVSTDQVFPATGNGVSLGARPDLIALEMARMNRLRLKEYSGRQVWIFPKKRSGQRCSVCFDKITQRKLQSSCAVCFGTGWVGGYHAPVEAYATIVSPDETTAHTNFGTVEIENTTMLLANYPDVGEGDLVLEAENIRWRIGERITKVRKGRAVVRQQVPLHRIPKSDIEYAVPLNLTDAQIKDLEATPARNYTNPQTLEGADLRSALTGIFPAKR